MLLFLLWSLWILVGINFFYRVLHHKEFTGPALVLIEKTTYYLGSLSFIHYVSINMYKVSEYTTERYILPLLFVIIIKELKELLTN